MAWHFIPSGSGASRTKQSKENLTSLTTQSHDDDLAPYLPVGIHQSTKQDQMRVKRLDKSDFPICSFFHMDWDPNIQEQYF